MARLPKIPTHVVSLYSGEAAEGILQCNSTYTHGITFRISQGLDGQAPSFQESFMQLAIQLD